MIVLTGVIFITAIFCQFVFPQLTNAWLYSVFLSFFLSDRFSFCDIMISVILFLSLSFGLFFLSFSLCLLLTTRIIETVMDHHDKVGNCDAILAYPSFSLFFLYVAAYCTYYVWFLSFLLTFLSCRITWTTKRRSMLP